MPHHNRRSSVREIIPIPPPGAASTKKRTATTPYKKGKIPKALREALWLKFSGKEFETKCQTTWCPNRITAYDFHAGHNVPESKGGATTLDNLVPICSRCNLSMGSQYTFSEWCTLNGAPAPRRWWSRFFSCFTVGKVAATAAAGGGVIVQPPTKRGTPKNSGSK